MTFSLCYWSYCPACLVISYCVLDIHTILCLKSVEFYPGSLLVDWHILFIPTGLFLGFVIVYLAGSLLWTRMTQLLRCGLFVVSGKCSRCSARSLHSSLWQVKTKSPRAVCPPESLSSSLAPPPTPSCCCLPSLKESYSV